LIQGMLRQQPAEQAHPLAATPERVDGEQLARELAEAEVHLNGKSSLADLARLREQVTRVADRAAWVGDEAARRHLAEKAGALLQRIGI
jgi:MoxR-like ATPase